MRRLKLLSAARAEIRAAMLWYESRQRGLGGELIAVIDEALEKIARQPEVAPRWRADRPYRKQAVRRFPYIIFFELDDDVITIVAVAHQRRRPGYWLGR